MFKTRELVFLGVIAGLAFTLGVALGTGLTLATGVPLTGGLANAIVTSALLTIGVRGVRKFGSGTLLWLIVSALCIPTVTMGPPGAHKLLIGLVAGLVWDVLLWALRWTKLAYFVSGAVMMLTVMLGVFGLAIYFGFPAAEQLRSAIYAILPINMILGLIGTYIGLTIYDRKLAQVAFVRNLEISGASSYVTSVKEPDADAWRRN